MKQRVPLEHRSASLRYWHRRALEFGRRGLTTHGTRRKRRRNHSTARERRNAERQRSLNRYRALALDNLLAGLTSRGGPRILTLRHLERVLLDAQIVGLANRLAECYGELPPPAQAQVLQLAHHLADLRRKLR